MGKLFRNIQRKGELFLIRKNDEYYGTYHNLKDALNDRDIYEKANWDISEALFLENPENKYSDVDNSTYDEYIKEKEEKKYIYKVGDVYTIKKKSKGTVYFYGNYDTFEEAKKRRDELIKNNWK